MSPVYTAINLDTWTGCHVDRMAGSEAQVANMWRMLLTVRAARQLSQESQLSQGSPCRK
jgi:hypothetical protein